MTTDPVPPIALDAACTSLGATVVPHAHGLPTFAQRVGPWLHDHRGRSTLASVGVLVDLAIGFGARSATGGRPSVVASISATMNGDLPEVGLLTAAIDHLDRDATTDTATLGVRVEDSSGRVLMRATGVAVGSDRPRTDPAIAARTAVVLSEQVVTASPTSEATPHERVRSMVSEAATRGLLATHLDLRLTDVAEGSIHGAWDVLPWTLNPLGSAQGGTILAVLATLTDLTFDTVVSSREVPRLAELHVDFFRSPTIDGGPLTVRSALTRRGRRIVNVDCELLDARGRVVAQTRAAGLMVPA
ncbi:MAG: hypothetical protein JWP31_1037 [Aeromicrobium sp.]|nr:hypothetical protein [Aeromicrobium sp.]